MFIKKHNINILMIASCTVVYYNTFQRENQQHVQ